MQQVNTKYFGLHITKEVIEIATSKPAFTKGKELKEENLYLATLEEIQAKFRGSDDRDVDAALENVNAELEKFGLEIIMGHAPDTFVWVRVEQIQEPQTGEEQK